MVARIDPTKCRLYPETIPEAFAITSSASGANIASYGAFKPFVMILKDLITNQVATETLRIDTDAGHGVIESLLAARPLLEPTELDILIEDSMDLWAVGGAVEARYAYTLRITQMTVFEKIKYGVSLSAEESALAKEYDIARKYLAGIMKASDSPQFKRIMEVAKKVTVAAGGTTRVGRIINVKDGEKAVIIGMSADSATVAGGVGSNDTYMAVNRDVRDLSYVKLDTIAMPALTHEIKCYIPAINRLEVELQSVTGVTNLPIRYRYGIADVTILEKIRWGIPLSSTEAQDAKSFNLFDAVAAGVL
jgi:hypothetical protein